MYASDPDLNYVFDQELDQNLTPLLGLEISDEDDASLLSASEAAMVETDISDVIFISDDDNVPLTSSATKSAASNNSNVTCNVNAIFQQQQQQRHLMMIVILYSLVMMTLHPFLKFSNLT